MTTRQLTGKRFLDELEKCGITHIVWLPDIECAFMYDAMTSQSRIVLVPVCREGEAMAIALGLILGGKNPVVLHQSSGLFESGESIRCLGLALHLPLLMLIGYVGWRRNAPITDSHAVFLEPILDTWGIKHYLVESDDDAEKVSMSYKEAHDTNRPVAVLIAGRGDR